MTSQAGVVLALGASLLLAGCPSARDEAPLAKTEPAPATTSTTSTTSEPAPAPADPVGPVGPTGPVGPVARGTPLPEEGRHQLDLLPKRQLRVGGVPVTAWIADTYATRRLGLMHVRELPRDHGMLFVYPDVAERGFWMKNTFIPLSIAYIDETGRIATIVDMAPHDERSHPSGAAVRFGLEMPKGWFRANGVEPGARVEGITSLPGYD
jgi:uncharacterized membrane protein (UPF0127 family)